MSALWNRTRLPYKTLPGEEARSWVTVRAFEVSDICDAMSLCMPSSDSSELSGIGLPDWSYALSLIQSPPPVYETVRDLPSKLCKGRGTIVIKRFSIDLSRFC